MESSYGRRGGSSRRRYNEYGGQRGGRGGHRGSRGGNRRHYGDRHYNHNYDDPSYVERRGDRSRERPDSGEFRDCPRPSRGRPPGLRGKEIGLYFASLSKRKARREAVQSRASVDIDGHRERHLSNLLANIRAADAGPRPHRQTFRDAFENEVVQEDGADDIDANEADEDDDEEESTFKMGSETGAYGSVPRSRRDRYNRRSPTTSKPREVPDSWDDLDDQSEEEVMPKPASSSAVASGSKPVQDMFFIDRTGAKIRFDGQASDSSDSDADETAASGGPQMAGSVGTWGSVMDEEDAQQEEDDSELLAPSVSEMYDLQQQQCMSDFYTEFLRHSAANRRSNERLERLSRRAFSLPPDPALNRQLKEQLDETRRFNQRYQKMLEFRRRLPSYQMQEEILSVINKNQVTVLSGETGCGKTTQVSQFILDHFIDRGEGSQCHIVCTQPRRISAISVAERVADERAEPCGNNGSVGYQIRLEKKMPRERGSILYCTTGILLQWLASDPYFSRVTHIILDEIHERDLQSDFLMIILKDVIAQRSDLKLVLMSATLNAEMFSKYYGNCPMLNIPGFTYPVQEYLLEDVIELTAYKHNAPLDSFQQPRRRRIYGKKRWEMLAEQEEFEVWLRNLPDKYSRQTRDVLAAMDTSDIDVDLIVHLIGYICRTRGDGAILVFLPGWDNISKVNTKLVESGFGSRNMYRIIPLHSMMPTVNQREVFERPPPGIRKIVIATNIAETSITIDDVVYVIDCGKIKMKNFDSENNISTLAPEWVSIANARQRRGRAGRVQPGECFHLYTAHRELQFAAYQLPEILRTRLEELCLQIKLLKLGKVAAFVQKAMQPPSMDALYHSLQMLRDLNALDENEDLTPLGFHLAKMPVDPQTGKMLLFAAMFSCLDPVLTVAASLSFKDAFYIPLGKEKLADERKRELSEGTCSDHLMLANAFEGWERAVSHGNGNQYCYNNFLSTNTLRMLKDMRKQFAVLLHQVGFLDSDNPKAQSSNKHSRNKNLVRAVVTAGLYPNVAMVRKPRRGKAETKLTTKTERRLCIHPKSVIFMQEHFQYRWLVYHLKMKTANINIYDCTVVSPYPLLFFGGEIEFRRVDDEDCLVVDSWIIFKSSQRIAHLVKELRVELDKLLHEKITNPGVTNWNKREKEGALMWGILDLITTADQ